MAGFTSEEVQTQINKFLTTQIKSSQTKLGLRDTLAMRDAAYDILTTSLLLRPDSYFYLIWLCTNRLRGLILKSQTDMAVIDEQSDVLGYRTKPIDSTTELANAQAALLELNAGLSSRTDLQGIRGSIGPAVDRFRRSTERFIRTELTKNVVRSGVVTETPDEARAVLTTRLADVLGRHKKILALAQAIIEAISRYNSVSLPRSAVADIVTRISDSLGELQTTMEGDVAVQQSREAMLELLTMRTILTKASSFRAPRQTLAPLATDAQVLNLEVGVIPAAKLGAISAPFNYNRAVVNTLRVQVGTPLTQIDIVLPGSSNASVRSGVLGFPFTPSGSSAIDVSVDGGAPSTMSPVGGPYATSVLLAAHLNTLVVGLSVVAEGNRMVFFSDVFTDNSSVEFDVAASGADIFLADIPLESHYAASVGVETADVLAAVGATTIGFVAEEVLTGYGFIGGQVTSGSPARIDAEIVTGADLVTVEGSALAISPSVNFETLGVSAGMALAITAPFVFDATIISVDDNVLVLDVPVPPTWVAGPAVYRIGPDFRDVPDGARVHLGGTDFRNSGLYRVDTGGGQVARLLLDRSLPDTTIPEVVSGTIETSFLKISAVGVGEADGITANPTDPGVVALGFVATATQAKAAAISAMPSVPNVDFLLRGVRVGDQLLMSQGATGYPVQTVVGVEADRLTFSPGLAFQVSNDFSYTASSARYDAWDVLRGATQTWWDTEDFSDTTDLAFHVGRLIRGANPSLQIEGAIDTYEAGLTALVSALDGYVVPEERTIANVLRMLNEQGMDRALDLLVDLEIVEFFTMTPDSVSYSTHLVRTAAIVTRAVAPVGKAYKSLQPGSLPSASASRPDHVDLNEPRDVDQ